MNSKDNPFVRNRRSFLSVLGLAAAPRSMMLELPCPECGFGNSTMANYCCECGKPMRPLPPQDRVSPLIVHNGEVDLSIQCGSQIITTPAIVRSWDMTLRNDEFASHIWQPYGEPGMDDVCEINMSFAPIGEITVMEP